MNNIDGSAAFVIVASSPRPVLLGMEFQYRTFWIEACRLFFERQVVGRVSIERPELRAFDDVVTGYSQPIFDAHNRLISGDHFQTKSHVDYARAIRGSDLTEPRFIGARRHSLLDRLAQATRGGEIPKRVTLLTPWPIDTSDPLAVLVSPRDGEMVLHHLFAPSASREVRELREQWRTAFGGATDDRMAAILRHLRMRGNVSQHQLDETLDYRLAMAGLAPVDRTSLRHPYVALAGAFISGATYDHDAATLERLLRQEKLWVGRESVPADAPDQLGIKSFSPFAYELEDEALVLNLLPFFHGRETLAEVDWDGDLLPPIREFVVSRVKSGGRYDLHLDTHISIGLAAGYVLDKADAVVTPIQRTRSGGRIPWLRTGATVAGPLWEEPTSIDLEGGPEIAIALEVTQKTRDDVVIYAKRELPNVGRVIAVTIAGGPSRRSVRDGDHAHALAEALGPLVRHLRASGDHFRPLHLFAAAPIALMFLIGREATPWGPTITYEFAFEPGASGAYSPAFHLPPPR